MSLDVNSQVATSSLLDQASALPDGTVAPGNLQLVQQQNAPLATSDAADSNAIDSITSGKAGKLRASKVAALYASTAGGDVGEARPSLPFAKEAAASPAQSAQAIRNIDPNGPLAFELMREAGEKTFDSERRSQTVLESGQLNAQKASAESAVDKAQGDLKSSVLKFMGSMAAAGATFGAGFAGASAARSAEKTAAQNLDKSLRDPLNIADDTEQAKQIHNHAGLLEKRTSASEASFDEVEDDTVKRSIIDKSMSSSRTSDRPPTYTENSPDDEQVIRSDDAIGGKHSNVSSPDNSMQWRAGLQAGSQSLGSVISGATEALDQSVGGAHESKQADINSKMQDVLQTSFKMVLESGKATRDKAAKMVDDAIAALKTHYDLQKSTNDNIAR